MSIRTSKPTNKKKKPEQEKPPIREMKILQVDKAQLKAEVIGLNKVICALVKDGQYNDFFTKEDTKAQNMVTLKGNFPLLSINLPNAFSMIIEYKTEFKTDVLLNMIDEIFSIGKDPTYDINTSKIKIATLLNSHFAPSENPNNFSNTNEQNASSPTNTDTQSPNAQPTNSDATKNVDTSNTQDKK